MNFPIILMFLQILALSLGPLPALNKQMLFCCYLQKLACIFWNTREGNT